MKSSVANPCDPSTGEAGAELSQFRGQPGLWKKRMGGRKGRSEEEGIWWIGEERREGGKREKKEKRCCGDASMDEVLVVQAYVVNSNLKHQIKVRQM